jgi:hypothetical protein
MYVYIYLYIYRYIYTYIYTYIYIDIYCIYIIYIYIALKEIDDVKVSLDNRISEVEVTQRIVDDMIGQKKMSDDQIVMLENQIKEDKVKSIEITVDSKLSSSSSLQSSS